MIGQKNLLKQIEWQINAGCFPRFSIIVGDRGSEKNMVAYYVSSTMFATHISLPDIKIDTIRYVIEQAYKIRQQQPIVYVIEDADDMSVQAKNALLKVTEEPPNNVYFIMTLEDANNTLDTIRSRATIFQMERYKPDEIIDYAMPIFGVEQLDGTTRKIIVDLCETPGDVDLLYKIGLHDFYDFVGKVVDHIATASGANVFKIADKIALKDEPDKYDLKLFWKAFASICLRIGQQRGDATKLVKYCNAYTITSRIIQKLRIKGVNKQMLFDEWILEVRKAWM